MTDPLDTDNKPCSVKARQGFSVYYRNRYLYSQYDAEKPVTRLIDSLTILPETLILAYSPALGTGLIRLLERLPENCRVLAVEFDRELYDFFLNTDNAKAALSDPRFSAVFLERPEQITGLAVQDKLRRCLTVEMSGGTAFFQEAYRLTTKYADDAIATFWKNHITLTRMGRLYARNLFSNTAHLSDNPLSLQKCIKPHSVSKPLLALGAGPSLDELLPLLPAARKNFFILAADAALPALFQYGLRPDAVVAVESQIAIEKAYIGFEGSQIPLIADMTSRPRVLSIMKGQVSFFMTEYCNEPFIARFRKLAEGNGIPVFPPLGSVGLYALELALYLRSGNTPVFFSGLDFAWGKGSTHCKGAPAHTAALLNTTRLNPVGNPAAAFGNGTIAFKGKNGATGYTTPNLSGYGRLLGERYRNTPLLFDAGSSGMQTGIECISIENMLLNAQKRANNTTSAQTDDISLWMADAPVSAPVFLAEEYESVKEICALIDDYLAATQAAESGKRLLEMLEEHSYLYLHFPDAARGPVLSRDFLARVQLEASRLLTHLAGC
ncbi:MAG: DUF115 domain-containing protein [Treponema sp.]|nr:DUF115 domain-containing protein [Candidatus Treponema caballi]